MKASIPVFRMVAFTAMIVVDYLLYIHGLANLVEAVRQSDHNICYNYDLISSRPQQEIEEKLGDGRTIHSGPSFARLQY